MQVIVNSNVETFDIIHTITLGLEGSLYLAGIRGKDGFDAAAPLSRSPQTRTGDESPGTVL